MAHLETHSTDPTPVPRIIAAAVGLSAVLALIVLAFSWPSITAEPRDLPIGITGPAPAVAAAQQAVGQAQPGAIDFVEVADRAAAVEAIETREVYAAIVLGEQPELLTASAGSPVVTQMANALGAQLQRALQTPVAVTDVVPLSVDDPRGTGFTAALFPLLLGGMIGGIGISVAVAGAMRRVLAVSLYAVAGGLVLAAVLQSWFGSLQGNWGLNAGAIALAIGAIAAPITGLVAVIGRAGIALGPVLFMLIANPISGASLPPQFLPGAWGAIGQWFPPGASATLLRDLSYFPSADATFPWLVLAGWALAGLALSVLGHARGPLQPAAASGPELTDVTAPAA